MQVRSACSELILCHVCNAAKRSFRPSSDVVAATAKSPPGGQITTLYRAVLLEQLLLDNTRPGFGIAAEPVAFLAKGTDAQQYVVKQGHYLPTAKLVRHLLAGSSMACAMILQDHTFEDDHVPLGYYNPASDLLQQHAPTPTQDEWQMIMVNLAF